MSIIFIFMSMSMFLLMTLTLMWPAGASMLTVHGRTRDEKGHLVRAADWEMIRRVKEHFQRRAVPVPIVANGGVERCADVDRCLRATRCDGVMSSEAVLENPALFAEAAGGEALLPVINTQQLRLTGEL